MCQFLALESDRKRQEIILQCAHAGHMPMSVYWRYRSSLQYNIVIRGPLNIFRYRSSYRASESLLKVSFASGVCV